MLITLLTEATSDRGDQTILAGRVGDREAADQCSSLRGIVRRSNCRTRTGGGGAQTLGQRFLLRLPPACLPTAAAVRRECSLL